MPANGTLPRPTDSPGARRPAYYSGDELYRTAARFAGTYIPQAHLLWDLARQWHTDVWRRRIQLGAVLGALPPERVVPIVGTLLDLADRYEAMWRDRADDERQAAVDAAMAVAEDGAYAAAAATALAVRQYREQFGRPPTFEAPAVDR
jgi:hypothetical protein